MLVLQAMDQVVKSCYIKQVGLFLIKASQQLSRLHHFDSERVAGSFKKKPKQARKTITATQKHF